jgi:hypothetical protein
MTGTEHHGLVPTVKSIRGGKGEWRNLQFPLLGEHNQSDHSEVLLPCIWEAYQQEQFLGFPEE